MSDVRSVERRGDWADGDAPPQEQPNTDATWLEYVAAGRAQLTPAGLARLGAIAARLRRVADTSPTPAIEPPLAATPAPEPEPCPTLYVCRCGWCGAVEGTVDPQEPCPIDDETGEPLGPHQFGVFDAYQPDNQ